MLLSSTSAHQLQRVASLSTTTRGQVRACKAATLVAFDLPGIFFCPYLPPHVHYLPGIVGALVNRTADIAAFPLTISVNRTDAIDVTYSYWAGGIAILVPYQSTGASTLSFLKPFSWELWLLLLGTIFGVALVGNLNPGSCLPVMRAMDGVLLLKIGML
jgi:Ligated ion channel L-glutamate- and glycine-binding site